MQLNAFHNTLALKPSEKIDKEVKALKLDDIVLRFFREHPHTLFTPWDVYRGLGEQFLIGSVRRSITNLTKTDDLIKTDTRKMTLTSQGKPELNFCWKYNRDKK